MNERTNEPIQTEPSINEWLEARDGTLEFKILA